ncbi:hypothetical protein K437DRAFT_79946 [Tilletiaria anomala UBC 951]|uniref:Uncharacterized protein n=1 Tax=Tilletiaria anomala (strain ATCC 24038 / CBS 436.72 / UBC 951) TaxID=1037660 RepID=A0A066WEQ5_TILAU|nr:uncharacterized protein K437DRAFT_79946 [Tilletiaria anomala UBC 951]KDN49235.1 hypothetical protein K437DRAFT_79946 [Tilletiaria anomala UBC 951]
MELISTGWEDFCDTKALSTKPYRRSFGISNLGLLPVSQPSLSHAEAGLDGKLQRIRFAKDVSPVGDALVVDVVANQVDATTKISIVVSWREGSVKDKQAPLFIAALFVALRLLASVDEQGDPVLDIEIAQEKMTAFCHIVRLTCRTRKERVRGGIELQLVYRGTQQEGRIDH